MSREFDVIVGIRLVQGLDPRGTPPSGRRGAHATPPLDRRGARDMPPPPLSAARRDLRATPPPGEGENVHVTPARSSRGSFMLPSVDESEEAAAADERRAAADKAKKSSADPQ